MGVQLRIRMEAGCCGAAIATVRRIHCQVVGRSARIGTVLFIATVSLVVQLARPVNAQGESPSAADPPTSARERFEREYPAALRKIDAYFADIVASGEVTETRLVPGEAPKTWHSTVRFYVSQGAEKHERVIVDDASGGREVRVWCRNPQRYTFGLRNNGNTQPYSVYFLDTTNPPLREGNDVYAYKELKASHAVVGLEISELLADESFSLEDVHYEQEGDRQLVAVKYDFARDDEEDDFVAVRGGRFWLAPELGWAVTKYRCDFVPWGTQPSDANQVQGSVEYEKEMVDGVAIPSRVITESKVMTGDHRIVRWKFKFTELKRNKTPLGEFTLSHYGLSEQLAERKKPWRWGILSILISFAGIAICMFGLWIIRRYREGKVGPAEQKGH